MRINHNLNYSGLERITNIWDQSKNSGLRLTLIPAHSKCPGIKNGFYSDPKYPGSKNSFYPNIRPQISQIPMHGFADVGRVYTGLNNPRLAIPREFPAVHVRADQNALTSRGCSRLLQIQVIRCLPPKPLACGTHFDIAG